VLPIGSYELEQVSRVSGLGVPCIRIAFFGEDSHVRLGEELQRYGTSKSLIIDVRDNAGGSIDGALMAAGLFLPNGSIVASSVHASGKRVNKKSSSDILWNGERLIVLVNNGTSGAAELFAGSLQAHKVASLVGTNTAGDSSYPMSYQMSPPEAGSQGQGLVLVLSDRHLETSLGVDWGSSGLAPEVRVEATDIALPSLGGGEIPDIQLQTAASLLRN